MDAVRKVVEASSSRSMFVYDVFLSFRGEDTSKNFTDHLYTRLTNSGFRTFRDDNELEKGEGLAPQLERAIHDFFSGDYASSIWCLNEVEIIMEHKRTTEDHNIKVLPVYYDVDPSDVRKQTGSFEDAFLKHEKHFSNDINKVKKWREALREAAELVGMPLQNQANGHQAEFITKIIKDLEGKLGSYAVLSVAPFTTGSEKIVEEINYWLQDGSNEVSIGMIHGMGGIGKTNIAKISYNINHKNFEGGSFVADVKAAKKDKHLVRLQKQVCLDILKKDVIINNSAEGSTKIWQAVSTKKILLVLDDVDDFKHVNTIMGMRNWFYPGSKILITTRNQRLVNGHDKIFNVELLDGVKSLQLFSFHAFGQYDPIERCNELSKRVVSHCGGLPLALEVLGRSFYNRNEDEWKSLLKGLDEKSNIVEILTVLEISYDSLQNLISKIYFST